jgi:NTP pyrophosphatase (non-canonical NTP hydrolase)
MDFTEYQQKALRTAGPKTKKNELFHLVLGLVGEAGEIAEKFKKLVRDKDTDESLIDRDDIAKELGDVLWYIATLADYLDLRLEDIAEGNIAKLASRRERGTLSGSGDNR